jgi:hypothetical protein
MLSICVYGLTPKEKMHHLQLSNYYIEKFGVTQEYCEALVEGGHSFIMDASGLFAKEWIDPLIDLAFRANHSEIFWLLFNKFPTATRIKLVKRLRGFNVETDMEEKLGNSFKKTWIPSTTFLYKKLLEKDSQWIQTKLLNISNYDERVPFFERLAEASKPNSLAIPDLELFSSLFKLAFPYTSIASPTLEHIWNLFIVCLRADNPDIFLSTMSRYITDNPEEWSDQDVLLELFWDTRDDNVKLFAGAILSSNAPNFISRFLWDWDFLLSLCPQECWEFALYGGNIEILDKLYTMGFGTYYNSTITFHSPTNIRKFMNNHANVVDFIVKNKLNLEKYLSNAEGGWDRHVIRMIAKNSWLPKTSSILTFGAFHINDVPLIRDLIIEYGYNLEPEPFLLWLNNIKDVMPDDIIYNALERFDKTSFITLCSMAACSQHREVLDIIMNEVILSLKVQQRLEEEGTILSCRAWNTCVSKIMRHVITSIDFAVFLEIEANFPENCRNQFTSLFPYASDKRIFNYGLDQCSKMTSHQKLISLALLSQGSLSEFKLAFNAFLPNITSNKLPISFDERTLLFTFVTFPNRELPKDIADFVGQYSIFMRPNSKVVKRALEVVANEPKAKVSKM